MEPLWSPVVANGGNRRQIEESRKPQKRAKTVATGCHPLPEKFHGNEGVDGSSPSEGSAKAPYDGGRIDLQVLERGAGMEPLYGAFRNVYILIS
jgi:hypothetical protein